MPKLAKRALAAKAKEAVAFGHTCAKAKRSGKDFRVNAAMCYSLCLQIMGDVKHFDGSARDLIIKTFGVRDIEVNPEVQ